MDDLIKVDIEINFSEINGQRVQTVNARKLHLFLESKQDFSDWIKGKIQSYGFVEDKDFTIILGKSTGGRPSKEYHVSIDMAKELSMVERNQKGRQARRYFIEMERRAKEIRTDPIAALNDPESLRQLLLTNVEKVLKLEAQAEEQAPKVEGFDRIASSEGSMCITDAAKSLQVQPKFLFKYLQANSWIYRRTGASHWVAYQTKLKQGLLEHKVTTVYRSDGTEKTTEQVRVTPKGLCKLSELLPKLTEVA